MGEAYSETRSSPSSSWTPSEDIATTFSYTAAYQPPLTLAAPPPVSAEVIETSSYTYTFGGGYSLTKGRGIGEYVTSGTFVAGGYEWAITFYPEGKKEQDIEYISLYIRLESEQSDVSALFEIVLVDQSGKGKRKIQTQFVRESEIRPSLMRHRGSQWGFSRYVKKKYLEKSGYLKNDCLVVNCKVGVLHTESPISFISDSSALSIANQTTHFVEGPNMENSDFKGTKLSQLRSAAKIILKAGSLMQLKEGLIFDGNRKKIDQYLHAVDDIRQSITSGVISDFESEGINVIQMAMKTLQLVFRGILDSSIAMVKNGLSSTTYSSSETNSCSYYELQEGDHSGHGELSSEQVYCLRNIAERLNSAGSLGDCIEVYKISRKSVVNAMFLRFGIGKWSINDFRSSNWEKSAAKIKLWIRAADCCYHVIFPAEKRNYEQIFDGVGTVAYDNCFLVIVEHVAIELSNFAEAITTTTASYLKLFDILDLYNALSGILPKIKDMFHSSEDIYLGASRTVNLLANFVSKIFSKFEDDVLNEQSNTPLPRGVIHSLTKDAMDHVTGILLYKELLTKIIVSNPSRNLRILEEVQFLEVGERTPLGLHLIWIIKSLKFNLEGKSRLYQDPSLGQIFLMNNVHYIVEKIKGSSELLEMIGEGYPTQLNEDVVQAATFYLGPTWDRVLYSLRDDGLNYKFVFYSGISKNALKERFKNFNSSFEDVCRTQSTWLVRDPQLRRQLHMLILEKLIPAYGSFLVQFRSRIESERHPGRYIKYSPEDLENKVRDLFSEH